MAEPAGSSLREGLRSRLPKRALPFLAAFVSGSLLTVVRALVGLVRTKYLALTFGTRGIGMISQGTQLSLLGTTLGSMAMGTGIINRLLAPEIRDDPARRSRLLGTALVAQMAMTFLIVIGGILAARPLAQRILESGSETMPVIAILAGVPFAVLASCHLEAVLFGRNRYDRYVRASVVAAILGLVAFFPLVRLLGLNGAFWSISAGSLILFFCFLAFTSGLLPRREVFAVGWDRRDLRALLRFSLVSYASGALSYGVALLIRGYVIERLGAAANGVLQVPLTLTAYYMPFITNPLWGRLHPLATRCGDGGEARKELSITLRLVLLLNTAIVLGILAVPGLLVKVAYTRDFISSVRLMPIEFIGDLFYFVTFTVGVYFLGVGKLRIYLAGYFLFYAVQVALVFALVPRLGLQGVPAAYLGASLTLAVASLAWFLRRRTRKEIASTLGVLLLCLGAVVAQSAVLYLQWPKLWRFPVPLVMGGILLLSGWGNSRKTRRA